MELLDLSDCLTNKDVSQKIKERVLSVSVEELIKDLSKEFVFHEEPTRKIYAALATNKNAILYGPGGYGKSVLVKHICNRLGIPVSYKIGYKDMGVEELLGVPNMKKLLDESKYETAFENSIFSKPSVLILEEFLDASPATAAALKDILTERGFREGNNKKESLIASVIITGNKSPKSMSIDDSTSAFYMERFPFTHEMIWKTHEEKDYLNFFNTYYNTETYNKHIKELIMVAKLCSRTSGRISPRVSIQAADTVIQLGIDFISTIDTINSEILSEIKLQVEQELLVEDETKLLAKLEQQVKEINEKLISNKDNHKIVSTNLEILNGVREKLKQNYVFSDYSMPRLKNLLGLIEGTRLSGCTILLNKLDIDEINKEVNKNL
jgi:MoxR-like ATPase